MTEDNLIWLIESAVRSWDSDGADPSRLRLDIRAALQKLAGVAHDSKMSLAEALSSIADADFHGDWCPLAAAVLRISTCEGLLTGDNRPDRQIVQIIERGYGPLLEKAGATRQHQTHEKIVIAHGIHREACASLALLTRSFSTLQDLNGTRQTLQRELNQGPLKTYLGPFGYALIQVSINSLLSQVGDVVKADGTALQQSLTSLSAAIGEEIGQVQGIPTFLVQDYFLPFLTAVQGVTEALEASLPEAFACNLATPTGVHRFEKRYPLHLVGSQIQVFIPLTNTGPGTAQDVQTFCVGQNCEVVSEDTPLGDVPPGTFVLTLVFKVVHPTDTVELMVEVSWDVIGEARRRTAEFNVQAEAQRTDLDWDALARQQPYSLDIVYGQDFYGRKDALRGIIRRLSPDSMQSCYISGQKRVGKSSLAHAVKSSILDERADDFRVLYFECGEIRHSTGEATLGAFGTRVEEFLMAQLPRTEPFTPKNYTGSLAPLSNILDKLRRVRGELRFVVIVDEFDEVNEELYRHGDLANTFFLNLRTLSSKQNIAFVLVGAERMPYVMAAQGDKLNRFEKESLDSFDLDTEWADYSALVRDPVKAIVQAHESALHSLFDFTHGHPYFTKMLCVAVYDYAVKSKDAEVSRNEIEVAARRVVSTLDINAFAHYWRDGIRGDAKEIEIVSLKRCRVLLAWARTARAKKPLTAEEIRKNIHSSELNTGEVLPILEDFCRRGVFHQVHGEFAPAVQLFRDWLIDSGFSMLVVDQLGDDLAEAKQKAEDAAYVGSQEIGALTDQWDLYQGHKVTPEQVRQWLTQVESHTDQRLLFKLLQNLRFVSDEQVRSMYKSAHRWIRNELPTFVRKSRAQRRDDIVVTFADGHGKSGAHYAGIYAHANEIVSNNVIAPNDLAKRLKQLPESEIGIVLVDDIIGTGNSLVDGLESLKPTFNEMGIGSRIPLSVVVSVATPSGERRVRKLLAGSWDNSDLEVCETVTEQHMSFPESQGFWESGDEKARAKSLVTDLGARVQKRKPLGFGDQGLLITFSRNCPNNSLPILHASKRARGGWDPLFPRVKS